MSFFELLLIAVSMSMDAFAVSICKGLSMQSSQILYQKDASSQPAMRKKKTKTKVENKYF